jgi:DNA-binding HxlR family transcriptional regulator
MKKKSFSPMACSIARAIDIIGDRWTLLVMREAFYGTRRFGQFQSHLTIATNILANRLAALVENGLLEITQSADDGRASEYRMTKKAKDMFPVLIALMQWGDRYAPAPSGRPVKVLDRETGREITRLRVTAPDGRPLEASDVRLVPGPGASADDRARMLVVDRASTQS